MPQSLPFYFVNQATVSFIILFVIIYIISRFVLPFFIEFYITRKYITIL